MCVCVRLNTVYAALCVFNGMRNLLLRQTPLTSLWSALLFLLLLVMTRSNACHDFISVIILLQGEVQSYACTHTHTQTLNVKTVGELQHCVNMVAELEMSSLHNTGEGSVD